MKFWTYLFLILNCAFLPVWSSAGLTSSHRLIPATGTIGDTFTYERTITRNANTPIPATGTPNVGVWTIKDMQHFQKKASGKRIVDTLKLSLTLFQTGTASFPAQHIGSDILPTLTVTIQSVLSPTASTTSFLDITGPKPYPFPWWAVISFFLSLALSAIAIYNFYRYFQRRQHISPCVSAPEDTRSCRDRAVELLNALKTENLPEKNEFKEWSIRLSNCIRDYFSDLYRYPISESTTEEIEQFFHKGVDYTTRIRILKLLTFCDQIKFAKSIPSVDDCITILDLAYIIIERTYQPELPQEEPGHDSL